MSKKRIFIIIMSVILCVSLLIIINGLSKRYKLHKWKESQQREWAEMIEKWNTLYPKGKVDVVEAEWSRIDHDKPKYSQIDASIVSEVIKTIDSNETAKEVGQAIIDNYHEKGYMTEYYLFRIIHYTGDNVWRYEYSVDRENAIVFGGWFFVDIDGEDGKILRAEIGE